MKRLPVWSVCVLLVMIGDHGAPLAAPDTPPPTPARLIAYEPLPDMCLTPGPDTGEQVGPLTDRTSAAARSVRPARTIRDAYPAFAAVAVDPDRDEVVFTDENSFQLLVYSRLENTPAGTDASRPRRVISGDRTIIEFQSGVYVDRKTGEIYAVNNDTRDTTVVFGAGASGDVAPVRAIKTPHGTFGIAVAESQQEILLTVQHDSAVVVYDKKATGKGAPLRMIQGNQTKLADPHGIAYDPKEDAVFIANFGSHHEVSLASMNGSAGMRPDHEPGPTTPLDRDYAVPGSGRIDGASIVVHRRTAQGNAAPLRIIEGPATGLNWPTGLAFDPDRRELYVANDMARSIAVFDANAEGNVPPKRVLKGVRTGLANPTGVALDLKNRELWVANFGGHSATVYDLLAAGDTAPKRLIRNAPVGTPSLMIGNPGALSYDTKREQILVPN